LVPILRECFDGGLEVPYLFEQKHVLTPQGQLLLPFPEGLGCRFGFAERTAHVFNIIFGDKTCAVPLLADLFDVVEVALVLLVGLLLEKLVLVDGPGRDY
jgi:hypothetical protein